MVALCCCFYLVWVATSAAKPLIIVSPLGRVWQLCKPPNTIFISTMITVNNGIRGTLFSIKPLNHISYITMVNPHTIILIVIQWYIIISIVDGFLSGQILLYLADWQSFTKLKIAVNIWPFWADSPNMNPSFQWSHTDAELLSATTPQNDNASDNALRRSLMTSKSCGFRRWMYRLTTW